MSGLLKKLRIEGVKIILPLFLVFFYSCTKEEIEQEEIETGTVTDIDNNVYKTVKIGNRWWMAENLRVTRFANGDPIVNNQSPDTWPDTIPFYCLFDGNPVSPGLLYNWYAVNSNKAIAPDGWRIPSDEEWKELEMYLGMNRSDADKSGWRGIDEGEKLRKSGYDVWAKFPNVWSTNESGFSAEAGGCRLFDGTWSDPGLYSTGFWWTCSETSEKSRAFYRYLDYKNRNVFRSSCSKFYGFSIRCVKID